MFDGLYDSLNLKARISITLMEANKATPIEQLSYLLWAMISETSVPDRSKRAHEVLGRMLMRESNIRRMVNETVLPMVQQQIEDENTVSMDLPDSTWSGEEDWKKFLVLVNGSVIPVVSSHRETIENIIDTRSKEWYPGIDAKLGIDRVRGLERHKEFDDTGGISGRISDNEMDLFYLDSYTPNELQIESISRLFAKCQCSLLTVDGGEMHGSFNIDSIDRLRGILQYGPEMAAASVEEGLVDFATDELRRSGLMDRDSDYGGDLGAATIELVKTFADQGHSGGSVATVRDLFNKLSDYKPLSPITDDPSTWMKVGESDGVYQSVRNPSLFSTDGGKTYYDVDEDGGEGSRVIHKSEKA